VNLTEDWFPKIRGKPDSHARLSGSPLRENEAGMAIRLAVSQE
jgi:hypothetical protein